jgi:hypothetical protein
MLALSGGIERGGKRHGGRQGERFGYEMKLDQEWMTELWNDSDLSYVYIPKRLLPIAMIQVL